MENGDSLNLGEVHEQQCEYGYTAGKQSCLILPHPGDDNLYYLFHNHISYIYEPEFDAITDTLFYTLIDMSFNEGLGKVVEKNIPLITEHLKYGQLTAVKHSDGIGWWVISPGDQNNTYYKISISEEGLDNISIQSIGDPSSFAGSRGGQSTFSPDGQTYINYSVVDGAYIFNFDRSTGDLNNFRTTESFDEAFAGGVAVSPNSNFMYLTTDTKLFQYNLEIENIEQTKILVDTFDGYQSPFFTTFYNAQLAPDCKIYIYTFATVDVLHVINNPNELGVACNFEQHAINLPFNHGRSLPHFPNYRLPLVEGEEPAPPCELVVSTNALKDKNYLEVNVFPNPAFNEVTIAFQQVLQEQAVIVLHNSSGEAVRHFRLSSGQSQFNFNLYDLPKGFYFYSIKQAKGLIKSGKLIVL